MRKHFAAALLFLALTLILTNPLALHVWNAVEDKQDALLNTWIVAWVGHALSTNPLELFNTNIFYPYTNTLAYSEILLPPGLFALPITLALNNSIFAYNLALLAMLWLNAFGMYLFVVNLTRRVEAGWIAGAIYAFNPFNLGNFAQLQLATLGFLPLALLFLNTLLHARERPQGAMLRDTFLFALFFILQSLSSFYYALLSGFAVALFLLAWLIAQRADFLNSLRRVFIPLVASFAFIAMVLIPFLLPYFQVQRELGFSRRVQESEPFSASLKQFTEVAPQNVLYGKFLAPNPVKRVGGYPLDNLFPGAIAILLALVGIIFSRAPYKIFLVSLLVVSFLLALGPRLYLTSQQATDITLPYMWLYEIFPPMRALRAPVRFDALINFALAALAGFGAVVLLEKFSRRGAQSSSKTLSLGIFALIALEYLSLPAANIATLPVANEIPDVYKWLAQQPHGVVLELPMLGPNENNELDISTQYLSTYHWQKTPDGYSGFIPPRRGEIAYEMGYFPNARSLALLRALDVNYVVDVIHGGACIAFSPSHDVVKRVGTLPMGNKCVYEIQPTQNQTPQLDKHLFVPSSVAAGAPFDAYLILVNRNNVPYAVKPTDIVQAEARWSNNRIESLAFPIPLVTSRVSVLPIRLNAPARVGEYELGIQTLDALLGAMDVETVVNVGNELAREVVLPASVKSNGPLPASVERGDSLRIDLVWLPYNKINAYYSASVRLVNESGDKVANVDRQPRVETLLWKPGISEVDEFRLDVPREIPSGNYRVEVLMYQADTDVSALLLDGKFVPQQSIVLGEIEVK